MPTTTPESTSKSTLKPDWIAVGPLSELEREGPKLIHGADRPIAVFAHQGKAFAVDNRCPHLGFPLTKGTVHDGILTCHWHQARFDLCSGCTFDLWADDVPPFETKTVDGQVFVHSLPQLDAGRYQRLLIKGMTQNIGLLQAKALVGMQAENVPTLDLLRAILDFGMEHQNNATGLVELAIAGNLRTQLDPQTMYFLLFRGSQQVAGASNNSRRLLREKLSGPSYDLPALHRWFQQWVEVRDRDASERVLLTAIAIGATPAQLVDMLVSADSQRIYSAQGHSIDFINKAFELLDHVGWDYAAKVLPLLLPQMTAGRGAEEDARWRQPIDLIALIRDAESKIAAAIEQGQGKTWRADTKLIDVLLGDDPAAIINALLAHLRAGAPPAELSREIAYAAALRLAHFYNGNEVGDWFNPQHTFSYANAVDQLIRRNPTPKVSRCLFHAAASVYMDRFLNVPPARLLDHSSAAKANADSLLKDLLEELNGRSQSNSAAAIMKRYLDAGHSTEKLTNTLAIATLREDLDFHTLQVLEAGVRQAQQWGPGERASNVFIGVIRDLAAFCPTPRARLKTATIALKLHRGESMHEE